MLRRFEAAKTKLAKTIGAPKTGKAPTKPKAITARAEHAANRVARRKKTMTTSLATAKRSGAKQRKAKAGASKKTAGRREKPT